MCFFLVLGEVGTFGQVHLVDKTRHLSLTISGFVSQATSDFIDQYIYTAPDRIIEKKKWENARVLPGHLQVGKKNKSGLLVPGYFPTPG